MSVRTFERRFTEQVGVAPKMYLKLFRLNQALHLRLLSPAKSWTAIAHECGYFDQMHFIKDFKQFTGLTPTQFTLNQLQAGSLLPVSRHGEPVGAAAVRHSVPKPAGGPAAPRRTLN